MAVGNPWADQLVYGDVRILIAGVSLYLIGTKFLQWVMSKRAAFDLKWPLAIHNFMASFVGFSLFAGTMHAVWKTSQRIHIGLFELCCDDQQKLYPDVAFWIHLFYLSKYYEFVDTLFLVLRKRPVEKLHLFHHASYIVACWGCSVSGLTVQWFMTCLNSFVHWIMYLYFALSGLTDKVKPVAKYITVMQMVQFVFGNFSLGMVHYVYSFYYRYNCSGESAYCVLSTLLTIVYFSLFMTMYQTKYTSGKRGAGGKEKDKSNGAASNTAKPANSGGVNGVLSSDGLRHSPRLARKNAQKMQ